MVSRAGSTVGMCWMRPRTQGALLPAHRDLHDCTLGTRKSYSFFHSSTLVTQRQSEVDQVVVLLAPGFLFTALHGPFLHPFLTLPFWLPRRLWRWASISEMCSFPIGLCYHEPLKLWEERG